MKRTGFWLLVGGLAGGLGFGLVWQWRDRALLEIEVERLRAETGELEKLRAANVRLQQARVPADELARRRADYEAVTKLRAEREMLRAVGREPVAP